MVLIYSATKEKISKQVYFVDFLCQPSNRTIPAQPAHIHSYALQSEEIKELILEKRFSAWKTISTENWSQKDLGAQTSIPIRKICRFTKSFQERTHRGKFQRKYRIESDKFLSKGTVTIREDGRVVGQAHLCDISQGEKQNLDCGDDPDVSFTREVKVLSQKCDSTSYQIRLTIKNAKTKPIKYENKEIISSAKFTVTPKCNNEQINNKIQSIDEDLQIFGEELQPNGEQLFIYEILLEYRNNQEQCQTNQSYGYK
ncbi:unnamed protein product [Didymodactylos carnosus]|uniref:Uncharacterized protein n=1 Tax=Didymodactylos carnosus TaxID=1234261 RepID=A0A8S2EDM0_9BILA|nr:unnamed protein product [Didymodactylos carnosus]CAF3965096.1 unnamed protein product [Didymodactylos carnosus]